MMSRFLFKLQISNDKAHVDFHPSEPLQTLVCEQMPDFLLQECVLSLRLVFNSKFLTSHYTLILFYKYVLPNCHIIIRATLLSVWVIYTITSAIELSLSHTV
jgi:hypothetical protein